jgi:hypothetical protein
MKTQFFYNYAFTTFTIVYDHRSKQRMITSMRSAVMFLCILFSSTGIGVVYSQVDFANRKNITADLSNETSVAPPSSIQNMTNATGFISPRGDIASLQYKDTDNDTVWIATGVWRMILPIKNIQTNQTDFDLIRFNAIFQMIKNDGTEVQRYVISDFKIAGNPLNQNMSTTFVGTVALTAGNETRVDIPININVIRDRIIDIWIDPTKVDNEFGKTPLYGTIL